MKSALRRPAVAVCLGLIAAAVSATPLGAGRPPAAAISAQSPGAAEAIVPFSIRVPDSVLSDLKARLARARFPDELDGAGWDYGMSLAYLKDLVAYWRDRFDWRAQERRLNQFSQFKTRLDDLDVHFIHQRSKYPNALPLLLLNGWPSSIDEYSKVIGPLTDPVAYGGRAEDAFHVVIPSMPGYGFSAKPRQRGYGNDAITGDWARLMARLGYSRYGTQGTDIGAGIATELAIDDAAHVVGLHLTGCGGGTPTPAATTAAAPQLDTQGYFELQATKPQTIGYSLSDSPVGLAAWIVEKYHGWTDHAGDLEKIYTKDQLLTTVMIYWVTDSGASSARIYYERRHQPAAAASRVAVPTGCANFNARYDKRPVAGSRAGAETRYNVVRWNDMPRGGHFPAFEQPQLWVDDVRAFFRGLR
jgi:pimeloyl-ACP methyl ester carboxylesterase